MGSPVSGVLACLFLGFIEFGPFKCKIYKASNSFPYWDDILFIYSRKSHLATFSDRWNNTEPYQ